MFLYILRIPTLARAIALIQNVIARTMRSGFTFALMWVPLGSLWGTFWHPDGPQKVPKTAQVALKIRRALVAPGVLNQ